MKTTSDVLAAMALGMLILIATGRSLADNDDAAATPRPTLPALDRAQQEAVGIEVRRPTLVTMPERLPAMGLVLDPAKLVREFGEVNAARAAEHAAAAERDRLQKLYAGGAGASLKMLEAARAAAAKAGADAAAARAQVALHWAPLLSLPDARRREFIDAAAAGRALLLRADVLGQQSLGLLPRGALVDVDGARLPGRVLGVLRQIGESQSVGLLVDVDRPPAGLGAGARVPVELVMPKRSGRLVPRDALLYGDAGAYVYKQMPKSPGDKATHFEPVKVTPLLADGDGWLVEGVGADDDIVVRGAAVLWSLQGLGDQPADDDD